MQEKNADSANKSQFVIRLNLIKGANGWEIPDFAAALGVSNNQAANYLSGRTPLPSKYLPILSDKYGIDTNWLLTWEGHMYKLQSVSEPPTQYRTGKAGHSVSSNYQVHIRGLLSPIVQDLPEATYQLFQVEGSSMEKTLTQGDFLLCRLDNVDNIIDNRIYVLVIRDQTMKEYRESGVWIKRCLHRKQNGYVSCRSDNKDTTEPYPTFRIRSSAITEVWYPVLKITAHLADPNRDIYDRLDEIESRIEMLEDNFSNQ